MNREQSELASLAGRPNLDLPTGAGTPDDPLGYFADNTGEFDGPAAASTTSSVFAAPLAAATDAAPIVVGADALGAAACGAPIATADFVASAALENGIDAPAYTTAAASGASVLLDAVSAAVANPSAIGSPVQSPQGLTSVAGDTADAVRLDAALGRRAPAGATAAVPAAEPPATTGLKINLIYDSAAKAAPTSFRDGMQRAADILESIFHDGITVNIVVGYGEFEGSPLFGDESLGGVDHGVPESYSELRALLAADETSSDDATAVASLPDTSSLQGQREFFVSSAQGKALGVVPADDTQIDGEVGMSTGITGNVLVSSALHELTHAMGRVDGDGFSLDLFRYSSAGVHVFSAALPSPAAYFSIDGGKTDLADFGIDQDPSDFLNPPNSTLTPNDSLNEIGGNSGALSAVDIQEMDVLGFNASGGGRDTTAPSIAQDKSLSVASGGTSKLTKRVLQATDPDNSATELTYRITGGPAHGTLVRKSKAVTSFTQADLNHHRIAYRQDGNPAASDRFPFTVSDPAGNSTKGSFTIAIGGSAAPISLETSLLPTYLLAI
jgi:hypothetical protein